MKVCDKMNIIKGCFLVRVRPILIFFEARIKPFAGSFLAHVILLGLFFLGGGLLAGESSDSFCGDQAGSLYVGEVMIVDAQASSPALAGEAAEQGQEKIEKVQKDTKPAPSSQLESNEKDTVQNLVLDNTKVKLKAESNSKVVKNKSQSLDNGKDKEQDSTGVENPGSGGTSRLAGDQAPGSTATASAGGGVPGSFGYSLDNVDQKPQIIKNCQVPYPRDARKQQINGHVLVRFHLDEQGKISNLHVKNSDPPGVFEACTLETVQKWQFSPAVKGGKQVPVWVELPIKFELR